MKQYTSEERKPLDALRALARVQNLGDRLETAISEHIEYMEPGKAYKRVSLRTESRCNLISSAHHRVMVELVDRGLVEEFTLPSGKYRYRLTPMGERCKLP